MPGLGLNVDIGIGTSTGPSGPAVPYTGNLELEGDFSGNLELEGDLSGNLELEGNE